MAAKMASTGKGDATMHKRAATETSNTSKLGVWSILSLKNFKKGIQVGNRNGIDVLAKRLLYHVYCTEIQLPRRILHHDRDFIKGKY